MQTGHASRCHIHQKTALTALLPVLLSAVAVQHTSATHLETLVQQVMTNLLSNAIKFSRTREQALIEVWGEETPSSWMVFVRDNGVGFEEKYKERLFGVFQRLHTDREFEGTGVGLAMVKRIVLRHGGTVDASSTPGQGATFSFTLPRDDQGSSAKSGPPEPGGIASVGVQTLIRNG